MKKKIIITAAVILVIALIIILLIKGCSNNSTSIPEPINEQHSFINANIELDCLLLEHPKLGDSPQELDKLLTETYSKHGLPTSDNETMLYILNKYERDPEVTAIIRAYTDKCSKGLPTEFYLGPESN